VCLTAVAAVRLAGAVPGVAVSTGPEGVTLAHLGHLVTQTVSRAALPHPRASTLIAVFTCTQRNTMVNI